ncbi:MAG: hypothetical protein FJ146_17060 [Deltaproteobacteria bacterium]|nr:hypothetical protein [Deltaproteobacteria bacterium]
MEALHTDIIANLTKIAIARSTRFCYGCYADANGRCAQCGSDDLMFKLDGVGVEYGTDWLLQDLLATSLSPADTLEAFEQSVADCYPETVQIGWITCDTVTALKDLDPVSWDQAHSEWIDNELSDGNLITFDHGSTYYWLSDVERLVDSAELPA